MKRIISVILAVMMLLSCFAGLSFNAFAADPPENGWFYDGEDWYYYEDGSAVEDDWRYIKGAWYWFDGDGWMACDTTRKINDTLYLFDATGKMQSGGWVYLSESYSDGYTWTEWFYAQKNGALVTGWFKDGGKYYYLDEDWGYMYTGICTIDEVFYCFDESGAMVTGWYKLPYSSSMIRSAEFEAQDYSAQKSYYYSGQRWVYAASNGVLYEGWKQISGIWYYFNAEEDCVMTVGDLDIKDTTYYFDENGKWIKAGWCELYGNWLYIENGVAVEDTWKQINGKWYYFDRDRMVYGGFRVDGKDYLFDNNGAWIKNPANGWHKISATGTNPYSGEKETNSGWFYIKNGKLAEGWEKINGKWYFFMPCSYYDIIYIEKGIDSGIGEQQTGNVGCMFENTTVNNGDSVYAVGADGAWITAKGWTKLSRQTGPTTFTDVWAYVGDKGVCKTGWLKDGGKWYYLDEYNGIAAANTAEKIDGKWYAFGASGAMFDKPGWAKVTHSYHSPYGESKYTEWYYVKNTKGELAQGWMQVNGKWYYLEARYNSDAPCMVTGWNYIGDYEYEFDYETGELLDPEEPILPE